MVRDFLTVVVTTVLVKASVLVASITLVFAVSVTSVQAQQRAELPTIGTAAGGTMSVERERLIGDYYMRQLRAQAPIIEDPVLREYLTDLGNRLVLHSSNVRFPFTFFFIRDPNI
ncbi:MAG: M48 family peptidase, partial [Gammaproteobacteria bacterium]|nr:M48 family peptidase [Gammaproteobacteria bacterium]